MRHLLEQRIVVDKSLNELSVYECYYNEAQYGAHNDEFRLVLIPTYNCNLKCTYCFEDCANNTMISKEDIQQVIRFVIGHVSKVKSYKKKVRARNVSAFSNKASDFTSCCIFNLHYSYSFEL